MTTTDVSEFPAMEQTAKILFRLDERRRRQVLAFLAEGYGLNLAPSSKRTAPRIVGPNGSEFPAMEEASELLDELTDQQQKLALEYLAGLFECKVQPAFKPPPGRGYKPRVKRGY